LGSRNTEGLHALVGGELNDFKWLLGCGDTEGFMWRYLED